MKDDDDIQDYVRPWVGLTDEELLQAYGWKLASGAPNWLLEEAKQELLGALRKVEAKLKEKNAW
jgi:predicted DNA-binding transcriptional regulator